MLILRFSLQGPVASLQWTCIKRTSSSSATDWMLANGTVKFASKLLGFVYVAYMMYPALMLLEQAGLETCCRYLLKCKDVVLKGQWEPSPAICCILTQYMAACVVYVCVSCTAAAICNLICLMHSFTGSKPALNF